MKKFDAVITRENIFMLIRYSGITLEEFANIVGLSKRWLQYVKSGTYDFDLTSIDKVCEFFNIDFINLTTTKLTLKSNYRHSLQKHHKNNLEYSKILSESPSISYTIEFTLVRDDEFIETNGMEIKDIRKILDKHNLTYKSSSLSNELQKSKFIKYEKHPQKKGTNLYKRK